MSTMPHPSLELGALARQVGIECPASLEHLVVGGVQHDSRRVQPGDLFVAIAGERHDGNLFAAQALQRGAVAVVSERAPSAPLASSVAPCLHAADARLALARLAEAVYGQPSRALQVAGITGTNGKTTCVHLLAAMLQRQARPALLGTLGFSLGFSSASQVSQPAVLHTTPEADDLARLMLQAQQASATHFIMEVSSHALALRRVDGVRFQLAIYGNLSHDHLDFHGSMADYAAAKARLFLQLEPACVVLNVDDPAIAALHRQLANQQASRPTRIWRCSRQRGTAAEVRVLQVQSGRQGIALQLAWPGGELQLHSPLIGEHNVENLMLAAAGAAQLDVSPQDIAEGSAALQGVPGRLERIETREEDISLFVDYAHTPDALQRVLAALRPLTPGKLIVVFGCGGGRDAAKRPAMGRVVAEQADLAIVTSDNPRNEPPADILAAIVAGMSAASDYVVLEDRRQAIEHAIGMARPGDTVLIAGKGHETYQLIGDQRLPFDDRQEARDAWRRR